MYLRECVLSSRHAVGRREDNNLVLQQHSFECVLVCVGNMFGFSKNIYFVFDNECQLEEAGGGDYPGMCECTNTGVWRLLFLLSG